MNIINLEKPSLELKKWFRLAKTVKEVENPCHSRQIGVVIVDPVTNALISSGHNGPPLGCPKNDDPEYLRKVVWPQLTPAEKIKAVGNAGVGVMCELDMIDTELCNTFCEHFGNQKTCPRKPVGAPSGQRLELCTCIHGEVDSITKANRSVAGCDMICYCGVPCIECTKVIINSGLRRVFAIDLSKGDYSPYSSRWLFEKSAVTLHLVKEDTIWEGEL